MNLIERLRASNPYHEDTLVFGSLEQLRNWVVARCVEMRSPDNLNHIDEIVEAAWEGRDPDARLWSVTLRFDLAGKLVQQ
jgi:2-oxo-4-hydroxy-4-carboxy--5-ureidoimidazoline (OHCU) decarboxylase